MCPPYQDRFRGGDGVGGLARRQSIRTIATRRRRRRRERAASKPNIAAARRVAPLPRRRRRRRRPRDYRAGCYTTATLASFVSIERRNALLSLLSDSLPSFLLRSLFRWLRTSAELKTEERRQEDQASRTSKGWGGLWVWKTSDFVVAKGGFRIEFPSRFVASESNKSLVS